MSSGVIQWGVPRTSYNIFLAGGLDLIVFKPLDFITTLQEIREIEDHHCQNMYREYAGSQIQESQKVDSTNGPMFSTDEWCGVKRKSRYPLENKEDQRNISAKRSLWILLARS